MMDCTIRFATNTCLASQIVIEVLKYSRSGPSRIPKNAFSVTDCMQEKDSSVMDCPIGHETELVIATWLLA